MLFLEEEELTSLSPPHLAESDNRLLFEMEKAGGGVVADLGSYVTDLARFFVGEVHSYLPVSSVGFTAGRFTTRRPGTPNLPSTLHCTFSAGESGYLK
jgi:predicted dehydrogenase